MMLFDVWGFCIFFAFNSLAPPGNALRIGFDADDVEVALFFQLVFELVHHSHLILSILFNLLLVLNLYCA